ncbi:hypothetical protein [Lentzea sp. NPDC059081]|uniref:hypothetical protein n=1 Tax=Lentzea sp. NPDC059081 TaxID=3346719 RepID=UPI00367A0601
MGVHKPSPEALLALQALAGNRAVQRAVTEGKLNIVGEHHDKTDAREPSERAFAQDKSLAYWRENEFEFEFEHGDPPMLRALQKVAFLGYWARTAEVPLNSAVDALAAQVVDIDAVRAEIGSVLTALPADQHFFATTMYFDAGRASSDMAAACAPLSQEANALKPHRQDLARRHADLAGATTITNPAALTASVNAVGGHLRSMLAIAEAIVEDSDYDIALHGTGGQQQNWDSVVADVSLDRAGNMLLCANEAAAADVTGLWKVGEDHIHEMRALASQVTPHRNVELTDRKEFGAQLKARRSRTVS